MKRKNFTPTKSTKLCSAHFKPDDYSPPVICGPPRLKNTAVPSVFDYPDHLQPKENKGRRVLVRSTPIIAPVSSLVSLLVRYMKSPLFFHETHVLC